MSVSAALARICASLVAVCVVGLVMVMGVTTPSVGGGGAASGTVMPVDSTDGNPWHG